MGRTLLIAIVAVILSLRGEAQDSLYFRANQWSEQIQGYYKQDEVAFPEKGAILFVGSSSIRMWSNLGEYFPNHRTLSRGFGGAWMSDILFHFQRLVVDYRPSQIVLYAGENDLANGVSPQVLLEDVKCFVRLSEIHLPGVPIIIISVKPSPASEKFLPVQRCANILIRDFCASKNWVKFIDISSIMFNEKGEFKQELYRDDKLHLSKEAYVRWAEEIEPFIIKK